MQPTERRRSRSTLSREYHRIVGKTLELQGIAAGVAKEHCGLLTDLPRKTHVRLDAEHGACGAQPFGQSVPVGAFQHHTEMRHRNIVAVDRIAVLFSGTPRRKMRDDLMTEQIEVNPAIGTTALFTSEHLSIKRSRGRKAVDGKGQMEWADRRCRHAMLLHD